VAARVGAADATKAVQAGAAVGGACRYLSLSEPGGFACGCDEPEGFACGCDEPEGLACGCDEPEGFACGCDEPVGFACGCDEPEGFACGCDEPGGFAFGCDEPEGLACGCDEPEGLACGCDEPGGLACGCDEVLLWLGSRPTPRKAAMAFLDDGRGLAAAEPRAAAAPGVDGRCGSLAVLAACEVGCAGLLDALPSSAALPSQEAAAAAATAAPAAAAAFVDTVGGSLLGWPSSLQGRSKGCPWWRTAAERASEASADVTSMLAAATNFELAAMSAAALAALPIVGCLTAFVAAFAADTAAFTAFSSRVDIDATSVGFRGAGALESDAIRSTPRSRATPSGTSAGGGARVVSCGDVYCSNGVYMKS